MEEIKRRTRVVGIFPNRSSADRLVGAQLQERQDKWQCERSRYLGEEALTQPQAKGKRTRTHAPPEKTNLQKVLGTGTRTWMIIAHY